MILIGGGTGSGSVDTSLLGNPANAQAIGGSPAGGIVKITDTTPTGWFIPAGNIVAIGQ